MNTTEAHPPTTTADLRKSWVIIKGNEKTVIKLRLNDECKNGHEDFSLTADIYEKRGNNRWYDAGGGCCHDHILSLRPDLAPFAALHLCDAQGVPMHAASNAFYWFAGFNGGLGERYHGGSGNGGKSPDECRRIFLNHTRSTPEQLAAILAANPRTQVELQAAMEDAGLPEMWQAQAAAAIRQLEEWTGQSFASRATRSNWSKLSDEARALIAERRASGYYTAEQTAARDAQAKADRRAARIEQIKQDHAEKLEKLNRHLAVNLQLVEVGEPNAIYYDHTNELAFNWSSLEKLVTREQFDAISQRLDFSKLPTGIKLRFNDKPRH